MDYFNDVLAMFPSIDGVLAVYESQKAHQKYLNFCSEDERRSYGVCNEGE